MHLMPARVFASAGLFILVLTLGTLGIRASSWSWSRRFRDSSTLRWRSNSTVDLPGIRWSLLGGADGSSVASKCGTGVSDRRRHHYHCTN
ncbi:hypothetical protein B0J17DRAFT_101519 [Rhizoctonia solani]|nr:hypothetical protein B0J17DRAFT_101519 [Rhizoctonia solani]